MRRAIRCGHVPQLLFGDKPTNQPVFTVGGWHLLYFSAFNLFWMTDGRTNGRADDPTTDGPAAPDEENGAVHARFMQAAGVVRRSDEGAVVRSSKCDSPRSACRCGPPAPPARMSSRTHLPARAHPRLSRGALTRCAGACEPGRRGSARREGGYRFRGWARLAALPCIRAGAGALPFCARPEDRRSLWLTCQLHYVYVNKIPAVSASGQTIERGAPLCWSCAPAAEFGVRTAGLVAVRMVPPTALLEAAAASGRS